MSRRRRTSQASGSGMLRSALYGGGGGLALFLLSVVVASFGFFAYAKQYVRSPGFRDMVADKASAGMKSRGSLPSITWEGTSAYVERFDAQGYEDAVFSRLAVSGMRAQMDLSTRYFRERVWKVPEITVSQVDVVFAPHERLVGRHAEFEVPAGPPAGGGERGSGESGGGLVSRLIPRRLELDQARINNLNLTFYEGRRVSAQATGVQALITPTGARESVRIEATGGQIEAARMPDLMVDALDLQWTGRDVFVNTGRFSTEGAALIEVEGQVRGASEGEADGPGAPGEMLLEVRVSNLKLDEMAAGNWKQRLRGDLKVEATIEGDPARFDEAEQRGTVTLDRGVIEALPVLDMLAAYTGSARFRRIALRDGGRAEFRKVGRRVEIRNLEIQSDGLARLTGSIDIDDGRLDGLLELGIIPGTIKWIPQAERKLFRENRDGHLWTTVRVGGTLDAPTHDLDDQLIAAGGEVLMESVGEALSGSPPEQVEGVMNLGRELLRGFFR